MKSISRFLLAGLVAVCLTSQATSQTEGAFNTLPNASGAAPGLSQAPLLSPAKRAAITNDLVAKWQSAADNRPGGGGPKWAKNLTQVIATADAENVLRATTATSLELLHAILNGYIPTTDARPANSIGNATVTPQVFGSTIADTVYTPLPKGRCRVADSRVINSPMPAGGSRGLWLEQKDSYADQGGNGTYANGDGSVACGLPTNATAYALSVTVLSPAATGVFKVFYTGSPSQTGNSILFNAGDSGATGDLIVRSCQSCTFEISVASGTQVHYVVDVIGYFIPPQATALSCYQAASAAVSVAGNSTGEVYAPACQSGYTRVSTGCASNWSGVNFSSVVGGYCRGKNPAAGAVNFFAYGVCCRVPGR